MDDPYWEYPTKQTGPCRCRQGPHSACARMPGARSPREASAGHAAGFSSGRSVTSASVVSKREATGRRVLQRHPLHLGGVDDPGVDHVHELQRLRIEAAVATFSP